MTKIRSRLGFLAAVLSLLPVVGLLSCRGEDGKASKSSARSKIALTSPAFSAGSSIPEKYTCRGPNVSPPLRWGQAPQGTKSLALIVEDPDAPGGTFVHWVIYNLPASISELSENIPSSEKLSNGATQGINSFHRVGYGGPCPPPGKAHRYIFKIYALDAPPSLESGLTEAELLDVINDHILAEGQLMGTFQR